MTPGVVLQETSAVYGLADCPAKWPCQLALTGYELCGFRGDMQTRGLANPLRIFDSAAASLSYSYERAT